MIQTLAFTLLAAFSSCSNNSIEPIIDPVDPPMTNSIIAGSFDSPYNRYSKGDKHIAQTNAFRAEIMWSDTVWSNDRTHRQLILWSNAGDVSGVKYKAGDLQSGSNLISADNVRIREAVYVLGDNRSLDCGEQGSRQEVYIADALQTSVSDKISSTDPTKLWLTIDIPKGTPAGLYEGKFYAIESNGTEIPFSIKMLVVNRELPDVKDWQFHLDIWQFPFQLTKLCQSNGVTVVPFSAEYESLMKPFYEMLADAGQKVVSTYIKDGAFNKGETMVDWSLDKSNNWQFDYTKFDKFVEFMTSVGIDKQISAFSPAGWSNSVTFYNENTGKSETKYLSFGSADYNTIWSAFLNSFKAHLSTKGWLNKTVIYLDEAENDHTRQIVNMIRSNWSGWKIGLAGREIDTDIERELYDYSTIYGYDRKATNNTVATFYTSCSQQYPNNYVTKEAAAADMTWMSWYAAGGGFNGYLRWAFDYWTKIDPLNVQDGANSAGDFNMIYRTDNSANSQPIGSIRFELLRYGIQDYEKIRILNNAQINSLVRTINKTTASESKSTVMAGQKALKQASL